MNWTIQRSISVWIGILFVVSFIFVSGFEWTNQAHAAPAAQIAQQSVEPASATQPIDVVVILDDSGSMATCWPWPQDRPPFSPPCGSPSPNLPSDPDELRYSAARLLLQLADDDDRIAVVRFDTVAEGVGALGTLQRVGDGTSRQQLAATIQPPTDYFPRGYTRIDLGLEMALQLLQNAREPGRNQYVLLLTDGEPSQPGNVPHQREQVAAQVSTLRSDGVLTFPVVLCNSSAGCSGDFLREQFADFGISEAGTAQDLLRTFSEIFSQMKPDRSVITNRSEAGTLQLNTRAEHGVQSIAFVTPSNGLSTLQRDGQPLLARNTLDDANINVNWIDGGSIAAGQWLATTADASGFAVVQAESYPQLLNPPPSIAESPASVRYYPAGKTPLLMARSVGPGANEPLFYNGKLKMEPFGNDNVFVLLPPDEPTVVRLQLGDDAQPLQLERSFRLEPRSDLPAAEVFSPLPGNPGLLEDGRVKLQVSFGGGRSVEEMAATVYVFETGVVGLGDGMGEQGSEPLVYQADLVCVEQICGDNNFKPTDGHSYRVYYVVEGEVDDLRFSDWMETELELEPAVYLRGLPAQLDLAQMPADGWTVELSSGTLEEIGTLAATLNLRQSESGEVVEGISLNFIEDVPEEGSVASVLKVDGLDELRPGEYEGEIVLDAASPSGLPMDVQIRPGDTLSVTLKVARPVAQVESQSVDFGETLFDTSPNFRLDQEALLPVTFVGKSFKITARLEEASCEQVTLTSGELVAEGGQYWLPMQLASTGPVAPATCTGGLVLSGPDSDYDVFPSQLDWQMRVASVEWSIVSGDLDLGDVQDAGTRIVQTVLVRFNGKTPFVLQMDDLNVAGSEGIDESTVPPVLGATELDVPPVEVRGPANESGLYEVSVTMIARKPIPHDQMRGTFYSGALNLRIAGLDGPAQAVNFNFRSPSIVQRYIAPYVGPVYSLPWVLCTGPLTLLLLLVMVARIRSRGFDDDELAEAEIAATAHLQTPLVDVTGDPATPIADPFAPAAAPQWGAVWGNNEWGDAYGAGQEAEIMATGYSRNGVNGSNGAHNGDPWSSNW